MTLTETSKSNIVKVQYFNSDANEFTGRSLSYYSEENLNVGEVVDVPVNNAIRRSRVTEINVPESEIAAFKDSMKTIPAGAKSDIDKNPLVALVQAAKDAGAEVKEVDLVSVPVKGFLTENIEPSPSTDLSVKSWHAEALKLLGYAEERVIKNQDDLKLATDDLAIISHLKKAMEDGRQMYVRPLNERVKIINDEFKKYMEPVLKADQMTRQKMTEYNNKQRELKAQQEKANALREEAARVEAAANGGELSEPLNLVVVAPGPPKRVITGMGMATEKANWTYEITDFSLMPDEYKLPNTAALNAFAKSTKGTREIPGVKILNKPIIAVRPR